MSILGMLKFHGSYEAINGGQVHVGLADLTGSIADSISPRRSAPRSRPGNCEVKEYFDSRYLMTGSPAGSTRTW